MKYIQQATTQQQTMVVHEKRARDTHATEVETTEQTVQRRRITAETKDAPPPQTTTTAVVVEPSSSTSSSCARVGQKAPVFDNVEALLPDGTMDCITIVKPGRYSVLVFYPLDFTFVCPTELCAFSDRASEFHHELNCDIVLVSVDSVYSHLAWTKMARSKGGLGGLLKVPMASDTRHSISKAFGCYMAREGHSSRSLYIIDAQGTVRHATLNDPPVGRNVDEIKRLVQAFQFTDHNDGQVCPVSWKPGQPTIQPSNKQAFFSSNE